MNVGRLRIPHLQAAPLLPRCWSHCLMSALALSVRARMWFWLQARLRGPAPSSLFTLCPWQPVSLSGLHLFLGSQAPWGLNSSR